MIWDWGYEAGRLESQKWRYCEAHSIVLRLIERLVIGAGLTFGLHNGLTAVIGK